MDLLVVGRKVDTHRYSFQVMCREHRKWNLKERFGDWVLLGTRKEDEEL